MNQESSFHTEEKQLHNKMMSSESISHSTPYFQPQSFNYSRYQETPKDLTQVKRTSTHDDKIPVSDDYHNNPMSHAKKVQSGFDRLYKAPPIVEEKGTRGMVFSSPIKNIRQDLPRDDSIQHPSSMVIQGGLSGYSPRSYQHDTERKAITMPVFPQLEQEKSQDVGVIADHLKRDELDEADRLNRGKDKVEMQLRDILKNLVNVVGSQEANKQDQISRDRSERFATGSSQDLQTTRTMDLATNTRRDTLMENSAQNQDIVAQRPDINMIP